MIIVSMTTIPSRKDRFKENLPSILEQTYKFDKLVINVQHEEDLDWYREIAKMDARIEINLCEEKWRSCNKLLPTLKKYPNDVIITIDDDIYYPNLCFQKLIDKWNENKNCIIAHEVNPIQLDTKNKVVIYYNEMDVKLEEKAYGKYLSNCTLFPPQCFDNTDLFDYDKMMKCTDGLHDELWFWIQSTLKHVKVIGLSYVYSFMYDVKTEWKNDEFRLCTLNCNMQKINEYVNRIQTEYGTKLYDIISTDLPEFFVNSNNVLLYIYMANHLKMWYNYGYKFKISKDVTTCYIKMIKDTFCFKN